MAELVFAANPRQDFHQGVLVAPLHRSHQAPQITQGVNGGLAFCHLVMCHQKMLVQLNTHGGLLPHSSRFGPHPLRAPAAYEQHSSSDSVNRRKQHEQKETRR